jgi:hypothetical protein
MPLDLSDATTVATPWSPKARGGGVRGHIHCQNIHCVAGQRVTPSLQDFGVDADPALLLEAKVRNPNATASALVDAGKHLVPDQSAAVRRIDAPDEDVMVTGLGLVGVDAYSQRSELLTRHLGESAGQLSVHHDRQCAVRGSTIISPFPGNCSETSC